MTTNTQQQQAIWYVSGLAEVLAVPGSREQADDAIVRFDRYRRTRTPGPPNASPNTLSHAARRRLDQWGYVVVDDVEGLTAAEELVLSVGELIPQDGGRLTHEVTYRPENDARSYSQSANTILVHTEAPGWHPSPAYLALFCHRHARGGGGRTDLLDVRRLVGALDAVELALMTDAELHFPGPDGGVHSTMLSTDAGADTVTRFSHHYNSGLEQLHGDLRRVAPLLAGLRPDHPSAVWTTLAAELHGSPFALAAIDATAHDLRARLLGVPLWQALGRNRPQGPRSSFSVGLDKPEAMVAKLRERLGWSAYEVKLAHPYHLDILRQPRRHTDALFYVDGNCGWELFPLLPVLDEMAALGVSLIEQPFPRAITVPDRPGSGYLSDPAASGWRVRPVLALEVWPIRQKVLRPGQPLESSRYAEDDRPDTRHFAALDRGRPVGAASVYHQDPPAEFTVPGLKPGRGWHLRGMVTLDEIRGTGAGSALLRTALTHAVLAGAGAVWCKARTSAADFYRKHGFQTLGHEFEIAGIGPHSFMYWMQWND